MMRQNEKIRETNQLLITSTLSQGKNSNTILNQMTDTKALILGFFMSLLLVLLALNLKSVIC